ncbi:MAG TPA: dienelactone hydrolase family protein [Acidimicrobiia bacterium]|nr:dienelactone hydrolase family protein [Acidimicrobiia bacterium]
MADVVLFHHALGVTAGIEALADAFGAVGNTVHVADLFDGRTFTDVADGVAYAEEIGFDAMADRGLAAVAGLPEGLVYAGFSLGVLPAQRLAQGRSGARGALLCHSAVPLEFFGPWPAAVPVQVHLRSDDPFDEGDTEAARDICAASDDGELFVYPGAGHLFGEEGHPDHDPDASDLLVARALAFFARIG